MICTHCGHETEQQIIVQKVSPLDVANKFFIDSTTCSGIYLATIEHFVSKGYDKEIVSRELSKFCAYWLEPSMNGKKLRWEKEKFFDVKRRIITWLSKVRPTHQAQNYKQQAVDESKIQELINMGIANDREDAITKLTNGTY